MLKDFEIGDVVLMRAKYNKPYHWCLYVILKIDKLWSMEDRLCLGSSRKKDIGRKLRGPCSLDYMFGSFDYIKIE